MTITGDTQPYVNQSVYYSTEYLTGANYTWYFPPTWEYGGGQGTEYISLYTSFYPGYEQLYVTATSGSCTLGGYLGVQVIESGGGGILSTISKGNNKPQSISVYDPPTGKFTKLPGDYADAWNQLPSGVYIIRVEYPDHTNTIKIIKQ